MGFTALQGRGGAVARAALRGQARGDGGSCAGRAGRGRRGRVGQEGRGRWAREGAGAG